MIRLKDASRFRRAVRAVRTVRTALGRQAARERKPADLLGRWALPSGATFAVYRIDPRRLALCGNGADRWHVPLAQLNGMLERNLLRYLGRR